MAYKKTTEKSALRAELVEEIYSGMEEYIEKLKVLEEELALMEDFEFKRNHLLAERAEIKSKLANFKILNVTSRKIDLFEVQQRYLNAYLETIEAKIEAFTFEKSEDQVIKTEIPKIKWNSKVSVMGYIFGILAEKGFIEAPQKNNVIFYKEYAELLLQHFEIDTTSGTLSKELSASSINEIKKSKFQFPFENQVK